MFIISSSLRLAIINFVVKLIINPTIIVSHVHLLEEIVLHCIPAHTELSWRRMKSLIVRVSSLLVIVLIFSDPKGLLFVWIFIIHLYCLRSRSLFFTKVWHARLTFVYLCDHSVNQILLWMYIVKLFYCTIAADEGPGIVITIPWYIVTTLPQDSV